MMRASQRMPATVSPVGWTLVITILRLGRPPALVMLPSERW